MAKDHHDWQISAPRWALISALSAAALAITFLAGRLTDARSREQQRIDAALADVPSRYQSRLAERVAVLETETHELRLSMNALSGQMQDQAKATGELTIQLRILNTELKRR